MDADELIKQAERILDTDQVDFVRGNPLLGAFIEAKEFLRIYAGERSTFFKSLAEVNYFQHREGTMRSLLESNLRAFIEYVESGLLEGISIERKAQIDVVSDFLEQAHTLLNTKGVHPAAPAVVIGAALEEFLRNWVEEVDLSLEGKKPSIDSYAKVLREADLITKQDIKDITVWAGLRNHAAHGEWDEVSDKNRISMMLEGVNLFMRRYGEHGT
jgi:hypothetical protein